MLKGKLFPGADRCLTLDMRVGSVGHSNACFAPLALSGFGAMWTS